MIRFGIQIEPQLGFTYQQVKHIALECEQNGFDTLWSSDHFLLNADAVDTPCLECWTLLSALASETTKLRLGSLVLCNSYRHPSLVAKMAASLDTISEGRLEFGFGAGWKEVEYKAYGIPFPTARERIGSLREAIQIIRRMWTEEKANFEGRYYAIKDAVCHPKPIQKPLPIWIGGKEDRLLKVVAEFGDGFNLSDFFATPDQYRERIQVLEKHCEALDRNLGEIKLSVCKIAMVEESPDSVRNLVMELAAKRGVSVDEYLEQRKGALIGTPEECAKVLEQFVGLGVTDLIFLFPFGREVRSLKLMAQRAIPSLR